MRRAIRLTVGFILVGAVAAFAQQPGTVSGTVRDSTTARPLAGAVVTLLATGTSRATRSDEAGAFRFTRVDPGSYTLEVRHLGHEPSRRAIAMPRDTLPIAVALIRIASLDTVRVRAADQAIYGVVATAHDLRPLPGATVQIIGASGARLQTDSAARFFLPLKTPGVYVVRARVNGYEPQTMSVTVPRNEGVEVALLLDSALAGPSHRFEMAYADFEERAHYRVPTRSAIVPSRDLAPNSGSRLIDALWRARSFAEKALRFSDVACVFVDGLPKPGFSLNAFSVDEVMAVEVYGRKVGGPPYPRPLPPSDGRGMLQNQWPKGGQCGDTGLPRRDPGDDVIYWVVIWLKH